MFDFNILSPKRTNNKQYCPGENPTGLFQVASIGFKGIKKLFQLPNSYATLWLLITELQG